MTDTPISALTKVDQYRTIFCSLFSSTKNLQTLYQQLHPEHFIREDEITLVDLRAEISETVSSSLGFMAKDRLIIVHQSSVANSLQIKYALTVIFYDLFNYLSLDPDIEVSDIDLMEKTEFYVLYTGPQEKESELLNVPAFLQNLESLFFNAKYKIIDTSDPESIAGQYMQLYRFLQNWPANRLGNKDIAQSAFSYCESHNILQAYFQENVYKARFIILNVANQKEIMDRLIKTAIKKSRIETKKELIQKLLEAELVTQEQLTSFFLGSEEE